MSCIPEGGAGRDHVDARSRPRGGAPRFADGVIGHWTDDGARTTADADRERRKRAPRRPACAHRKLARRFTHAGRRRAQELGVAYHMRGPGEGVLCCALPHALHCWRALSLARRGSQITFTLDTVIQDLEGFTSCSSSGPVTPPPWTACAEAEPAVPQDNQAMRVADLVEPAPLSARRENEAAAIVRVESCVACQPEEEFIHVDDGFELINFEEAARVVALA